MSDGSASDSVNVCACIEAAKLPAKKRLSKEKQVERVKDAVFNV